MIPLAVATLGYAVIVFSRLLLATYRMTNTWRGPSSLAHGSIRLVLGQVLPSTADFDASRIRWALFAGTVLPVTLVMIAGRRSMLSQAAVFISEFVATVFFPARLVFQLIRR